MTEWKYDPKRGADLVEPRRAEIVAKAQEAADVLFYLMEEKEQQEIIELRAKYAVYRRDVTAKVDKIAKAPAMDIVRKYWNMGPDELRASIVSGFASKMGDAQ